MNSKDLLATARKRLAEAADADRENRREDMDDLEKLVGRQWPEEIRREREADNKPVLTMNRLPQFVRQVTGDIRRMNPAIKVLPASDDADDETAELIEDLVRQIEYASDASSIYEQTAELAAACSIGWFRVLTEWADDTSFSQEIKLRRIRNSFSVYCDPKSEMPTREDADYLFITEKMRREDFEAAYPGKGAVEVDADSEHDGLEHWHEGDSVVVAEYYWKEPVKRDLYLLVDGQVTTEKPADKALIDRTRKVDGHKVMWAKVSGEDVLEGPIEQAGEFIPVIAVTGEEWQVGERVHRSSVIRYAKDAQQMYNFWRSSQTEFAALQPKAPYLVTPKQISGFQTFWNEANSKNRPYLPYNPDDKAAPPQRMTPPISSQAMFEQVMSAAEDMKATTGIYDAGLGNQSNEKSGIAIRQRQMESDVSTSIYTDNMAKAIATCGRIIVSMVPQVYDTQRNIRVMSAEDKESLVTINRAQIVQGQQFVENDLTRGKYDVRVTVGPNYSTRRQETQEGMISFVQAFPSAAPVVGDLVAKSMDWPDADKFAERLEKMLPPGMKDMADLSPEQQMQMQQAMQAQMQQQQMQQAAQEADIRRTMAEAQEAESEAQEAGLQVMERQLELAAKSGLLNEAIGQAVQAEVARALQSVFQP